MPVHALDAARKQGAERRRQDDGPPVGGLASALQSLQDHDDVVQRRLVELPATPQGIHVQLDVPVDPLGRIVVLGIPGQAHGGPDASEIAGAVCRERRLDTDELRRADHPVHVHESRQPSGPSIAVEPRVDGHQVEVEQGRPNQGVGARGAQPLDERSHQGRGRGGVRRKVEPASGRDRHAAIGSPLVSLEAAQHGGVELLQQELMPLERLSPRESDGQVECLGVVADLTTVLHRTLWPQAAQQLVRGPERELIALDLGRSAARCRPKEGGLPLVPACGRQARSGQNLGVPPREPPTRPCSESVGQVQVPREVWRFHSPILASIRKVTLR